MYQCCFPWTCSEAAHGFPADSVLSQGSLAVIDPLKHQWQQLLCVRVCVLGVQGFQPHYEHVSVSVRESALTVFGDGGERVLRGYSPSGPYSDGLVSGSSGRVVSCQTHSFC